MLAAVATRADSEWGRAIGAAIDEAMGDRSRRWLADQIGVDSATASRILSGRSPLDVDRLDLIASALGVTKRSLLARAGYLDDDGGLIDPERVPPGARRAIRAILREFGEGVDSVGDDGSHGP